MSVDLDKIRRDVAAAGECKCLGESMEKARAGRRVLTQHAPALLAEVERLRGLLSRWVQQADAGELDGVDLLLMSDSEDSAEKARAR